MRIRRCSILFLEPREEVAFDLDSLLGGGTGLRRQRRWLALAPHLQEEVEVDAAQRELLGAVGPVEWVQRSALSAHAPAAITRLLKAGLLIADGRRHASHRERDAAFAAVHWWPLAALAHRFGRWQAVDSVSAMEENGTVTAEDLRDKFGPPPPAVGERTSAAQRLPLPKLAADAYEKRLAQRATCRNFDTQRPLPLELLARMLQRVPMAQAQVRVQEDTVFLKKHVPSGGSLHATEAYLLVQRVDGLAPGLYHYHPVDHALEPLPRPPSPLAEYALRILAGQHWFAEAPVLLVLAPRYARSFWKYRNHAKAYRALVLDSGHLSQALYMSATELGLGAFVTSAINEIDIEQGFGLDPLAEGPLAICGFGWRDRRMRNAEFDPAGAVWALDQAGSR